MSSPEETELSGKKAELKGLSDILADKELDLEDLKLTIMKFQHRYYSEVGKKYVELDELRAQIAEFKSRQKPQDHKMSREAIKARTQARKAAEEYADSDIESQTDSKTDDESAEAKKLYRKIASIIHPDKATDDNPRHLRTRLMAELNEAYKQKDIAKMQSILDKWQEMMNVKHYSRPTTIKIPDSVRTSFSSPKGRFLGAWPKNGFTRGPRNDDLRSIHVQARASAAFFLAADIR